MGILIGLGVGALIVAGTVIGQHLILKAQGYYEPDWGDDT